MEALDSAKILDWWNLDPWHLPKMPLERKDEFPQSRGVYFVVKHKRMLYIGITGSSFQSRWKAHHVYNDLKNEADGVYVTFWESLVSIDELIVFEKELIRLFNPEMNRSLRPQDLECYFGRMASELLKSDEEKLALIFGHDRIKRMHMWANATGKPIDYYVNLIIQDGFTEVCKRLNAEYVNLDLFSPQGEQPEQ